MTCNVLTNVRLFPTCETHLQMESPLVVRRSSKRAKTGTVR